MTLKGRAVIDVNLSLTDKQFKLVQKLIYEHAGISLQENKQTMVQGRLAKRLRALNMDAFDKYLKYLEQNIGGVELVEFINCLTTNKTDFFRENHHFQFLSSTLLPKMRPGLEAGSQKLRIWSAACSTGEEPYSIAMTLREAFPNSPDMGILASDIDTQVLQRCHEGVYPGSRVVDIPRHLLHRYFDKEKAAGFDEDGVAWRAKNTLRDLIRFRRINFQEANWPIQSKFDVIFCRNVMIYFDTATQGKLVERFANYLQPEGYLIIGHSETLSGVSDRFDLVGNTVYQLKPDPNAARRVVSERGHSPAPHARAVTAEALARAKANAEYEAMPSTKPRQAVRVREPIQPIIVGEIHACYEPKWITTLLGSCVSACLFDERISVGGMNHFMLPIGAADSTTSASYGVHAMEMLINSLMKLGADRRRLKAKLFGGGAVIRTSDTRWNVGKRNVDFAKSFLEAEGIPLVASHTGGSQAMHVRFHTRTNKAIVRVLDDQSAAQVVASETAQPVTTYTNSVTLF